MTGRDTFVSLLADFRVVQLGPGLAAAVCGRILSDLGAEVACTDLQTVSPLDRYLNHQKRHLADSAQRDALSAADFIVVEGSPSELRFGEHDTAALRRLNRLATLVTISPFGQTGPRAEQPATDLTLLYASGIARLLTGQVDDLSEAPIRPVGVQSAFVGGLAAACAGMHAALGRAPAEIDVSIHEALATLAMTELTTAGLTGKARPRKRVGDGNGATVCILPARDGYTAISPREDHQWAAWLEAMGSPEWGRDPRFTTKRDRVANWDVLHALMSEWSRQHDKQWIANAAQAARVPSFPLRELSEHFASPQLQHRRFWRTIEVGGRTVKAPGPPFGVNAHSTVPRGARARELPRSDRETSLQLNEAKQLRAGDGTAPAGLPLSGVRVLDFSWVIAGPTTTRHLAAMGAEVIKIEAPGRGDPGRTSELHTVLGQRKRGIVLDLKQPDAVATARALAANCDVLVENFATGVMDRLGLGATAVREVNPELIYVSASGLGRTGPESRAAAYGTLLQCYAGFAGLNRHPNVPPRVGFAWLDPMCGLMMALGVAAALWRRRRGEVVRIDFSMIEAMLWTLAEPLLAAQLDDPPQPRGNESRLFAPHGAYRCAGDDAWLSLAVRNDDEWRRLCAVVPGLRTMAELAFSARLERRAVIDAALSAWLAQCHAPAAEAELLRNGVPAAALASSADLVASPHLRMRGFWERHGHGVLPGLPWQASFGRASGPAPGLGADTDAVLQELLGLDDAAIASLRRAGALG
jgi:crotonobetainyl-CoA:carnitine CoA-transferase CaiB-like acyl-CoA transferase